MPFAKHLFEAADRLRGSVESAEYKHLVLGLLFLKYVSDSFRLRRDQLETETRKPGSGVYTSATPTLPTQTSPVHAHSTIKLRYLPKRPRGGSRDHSLS